MGQHTVKDGECIVTIARNAGCGDWKTIHDDPQNQGLKRSRKNPNLLHPGDNVFVPDRQDKPVTMKTGKAEKLSVKVPKCEVHLRLLGPLGKPLAREAYQALGKGLRAKGKTDGDGRLVLALLTTLDKVRLSAAGMTWELLIGALNPLADAPDGGISGLQARLSNLGFDPGPVDGVMSAQTEVAIRGFQRKAGLKETGKADADTLKKLAEMHGC